MAAEIAEPAAGKPVVDVTNRMSYGEAGPDMDTTSSNAEEVAAMLPRSPVVKAFNTLFASHQTEPTADGVQLDGFVAGDDPAAKAKVLELVRSLGLRPIDVGPLVRARQLEALAFHEGIPGHHLQIARAIELAGVPSFRRQGQVTAYVEGWGLYAETLAGEMGFYQDPNSYFGRLTQELWRASRLVVDTGMHAKRWSREQAIDYLLNNTPNPKGQAVKAIERYMVMPGQATAYTVGMLRILELREKAKTALGPRFDIRDFHEVVLGSGPVSLSVLDRLVEDYIAGTRS